MTIEIVDLPIENGGSFHSYVISTIIWYLNVFNGDMNGIKTINHPAIGVPPLMETPIYVYQRMGCYPLVMTNSLLLNMAHLVR
jgi:hypothetical protein